MAKPPKDKRGLSPEDKRLWRAVAKTLDHHKPMDMGKPMNTGLGADVPTTPPRMRKPKPSVTSPPVPPPVKPAARHLSALPDREQKRIHRQDRVEARLDLHGMTEDQAHAAVHRFLTQAQQMGVRVVLIITGKGKLGAGVLRKRLPMWLNAPDIRPLVAGFSQSGRRHGGDGAFYVRVKQISP